MKNKIDEAWRVFYDLMRNYPLWPSTFSTCQCGRMLARGGGECAKCLEEKLATMIGNELAEKSAKALKQVQDVWEEIRGKAKCGN